MARLTKTGVLLAALLGVLGTARADLREAVRASDLAYLRALLAVPLPPDERDGVYEGDTALHLAAQLGNVEAVRLLLEAGATVDAEGLLNRTPLHDAASGGHVEVAQLLLDHGADMHHASVEAGDTPVEAAIAEAQPEVLRLFVARGAEVTPEVAAALGDLPRVRQALASGGTGLATALLHRAAALGQTEVVRFLLDSGADPNSLDATPTSLWWYQEAGMTAIQRAAHWGQEGVLQLLRQHGAAVTIHQAAYTGEVAMLRELLDEGADVNARDAEEQATPLHWAALESRLEAVQLLLQRGAKIEATDKTGYTPLTTACAALLGNAARTGVRQQVIEYLLEQGADPDSDGGWALNCAINARRPDMVQLLLDHGAGASIDLLDGYTALHAAAEEGDCEVISLLLARGAKVNEADKWGATPLHQAAENGQRRAAELLIANGAKVEKQAWLGAFFALQQCVLAVEPSLYQQPDMGDRAFKLTPLAVAAGCGYPATAATLIKHGADVNAKVGPSKLPGQIGALVSRVKGQKLVMCLLLLSGMDVPPEGAEVAAKVRSDTQLQGEVDALMAL